MLALTFWKVSPKGKAFIFIGVPFMAVIIMVIITGGVIAVAMAVVATVVAVAPGKGSKKNPKKSSPWKKRGIPSGLPTQKGV